MGILIGGFNFLIFYQAWYKQNLQISIPVSIVAGIVALLILFALLKCVKRCCCGRSKPKVVPQPVMATAIPPNVTGTRIPSWTSLQNNRTDFGEHSRRDSAQPLMPPRAFNLATPPRGGSPAFNGRPSDDIAPVLYPNPFEPAGRLSPPHPTALRPGGRPRSSLIGTPEPSYPLPPAAPRESTWGGPGMAGVGARGGPGSGPGRTNWVDEQLYNGPR